MRGGRSGVLGAVAHAVRLIGAGLVAGVVAGAVAGLGSRLAMLVVRLMNPSHNGEITHANSEVGRITVEGTLALVFEGALFYGILGAVVYLLVRRWMPWNGLLKGLAFGLFLLVVAGPVVLDGNYEYFRYTSPTVAAGLFALLYPLYGVVLAPLTEWWGGGAHGPPRNRAVSLSGYLAVAGLLLWSLVRDLTILRDVFHILG